MPKRALTLLLLAALLTASASASDLLLQEAALAVHQGELAHAGDVYQALLDSEQTNPQQRALAQTGLVLIACQTGEFERAQALLNKALTQNDLAQRQDLLATIKAEIAKKPNPPFLASKPPLEGTWEFQTQNHTSHQNASVSHIHSQTRPHPATGKPLWELSYTSLSHDQARSLNILADSQSLRPIQIDERTWSSNAYEERSERATTTNPLHWHSLQIPFILHTSNFEPENLGSVSISAGASYHSLGNALSILQTSPPLFTYRSHKYENNPRLSAPYTRIETSSATETLVKRDPEAPPKIGPLTIYPRKDQLFLREPLRERNRFDFQILESDFSRKTSASLHLERILPSNQTLAALARHAERQTLASGSSRFDFRQIDPKWTTTQASTLSIASRRYRYRLGDKQVTARVHIVASESWWLEIEETESDDSSSNESLAPPNWLLPPPSHETD